MRGTAARAAAIASYLVQLDRAVAVVERPPAVLSYQFVRHSAAGWRSTGRSAPRAAEQRVQRLAGGLAGEVPERDVEPGEGEGGDAEAAEDCSSLLDLRVERINFRGIFPTARGAIMSLTAAATARRQE